MRFWNLRTQDNHFNKSLQSAQRRAGYSNHALYGRMRVSENRQVLPLNRDRINAELEADRENNNLTKPVKNINGLYSTPKIKTQK